MKFINPDEILIQFEPLVHKVLSQLNVRQHFRDYDDFAQELRLKLLEVYQDFDGDPLVSDRYRFTAYASQCLKWRGLDLLRQYLKSDLPRDPYDFLKETSSPSQAVHSFSLSSFCQEAQKLLSPIDFKVLSHLAEGKQQQKEIADLLGLSSSRISRVKKKLAETLKPFKTLLYDHS